MKAAAAEIEDPELAAAMRFAKMVAEECGLGVLLHREPGEKTYSMNVRMSARACISPDVAHTPENARAIGKALLTQMRVEFDRLTVRGEPSPAELRGLEGGNLA